MIIQKNAHIETENPYRGRHNPDGLGRTPGLAEGHPGNEV
jgi:hypothetical protein